MFEFLSKLLDTSDFPERWNCGQWAAFHGWLHIVADLATFAAYMAIPFVLIFFLLKRKDIPFPKLFYLFAAFIFTCGTAHLIEATIFWWPIYRVSAVVKIATACVSWATVIAIVAAAPRALAMRSAEEMEAEIEQRELVEAKLRKSEERLSLAVAATNDAIWDCDLATGSVWWNEAYDKIFGERPPGTSDSWEWWVNHIHPEDRDRVSGSLRAIAASASGKRWTQSYRYKAADGSYRNVIDRALVARDENGKATRILGAMSDNTEALKSQQRLLQAERLSGIGEAMTGLVHESRNALARSQAGLNLLSRKIGDQPDLLRYINESLLAQKDLQQLFEEVRQYAVMRKVDRQPAKLREIVEVTWNNLSELRKGRVATLSHDGDAGSIDCGLDEFAIGNVFRNMIENSLAACADPIELRATYRTTIIDGADAVEVTFRDNGPGLDDDQSTHIFDAFYTTKTQGTGLGMAISKRTVEAHQGTIEVNSNFENGTEFVIVLPREAKPI